MNDHIAGNLGARRMGAMTVVMAATPASLVAVFALAKPSDAQDPILTVNPSSVDLGSVTVGATPRRKR